MSEKDKMEFEVISDKEFKNIQDNFGNSNFYQTVEWANLKRTTGWNSYFVCVKRDGEIVLASMILGKKVFLDKKIFYAPRGFLTCGYDRDVLVFFIDNLKKFLKKEGGFLFKFDPMVEYNRYDSQESLIGVSREGVELYNTLREIGFKHNGFTVGYSREIQFRWSYVLELNKSMEDIYANMDKRCRRCIRKADSYPLVLMDVTDSNIDDFKAIMEHTSKRQNHYDRSKAYYLDMKKYLGNRVKMIVVYLDKNKYIEEFGKDDKLYNLVRDVTYDMIPVSAGVFIFDNDRTNYVYGGSYAKYMPFMASYKIQMEMIMLSKNRNVSQYDFGGISGDFTVGSPNYGVYEFKRGFGGHAVEYIGEFDYVIDNGFYSLYNLLYDVYRYGKKIAIKK